MRHRSALGRPALAASLLAAALVPGAVARADDAPALDTTRDTLARWVETRQLISEEKEDWKLGKELLDQRIEVVRGEIASVEARIAETERALADADRTRRELRAEHERLGGATAELAGAIRGMEQRTTQLLPSLPDPLRERVKALSQRIPANPEQVNLSLSQRFQNVIGILNEVNRFNGDVTVNSEIRAMPDGSNAEVKTLYLGIGQAYYVTSAGDAAGIGRPTPEGWRWTPANDLAPSVAAAVAILEGQSEPAFVPLAVEIQ